MTAPIIDIGDVAGLRAAIHNLQPHQAGPARKAIEKAWHGAARELQPKIREHAAMAFGGKKKLSRSYRAVLDGRGDARTMEIAVYSRVPATVPHDKSQSPKVRAKNKKFLAIPLKAAQKKIRSTRLKDGARIRAMIRIQPRFLKNTFLEPAHGAAFIVYQRITSEMKRSKLIKGARGKFKRGEIIPMFALVPSITYKTQRTDIVGEAKKFIPVLGEKTVDALTRAFVK